MCHVKNGQLCNNKNCKNCEDASLASLMIEKNQFIKCGYIIRWSEKNKKSPREILKDSNDMYIFVFEKTGIEFECSVKKFVESLFFPNIGCCANNLKLCCDLLCKKCFDNSACIRAMSFDSFVKNEGKIINENGRWSDENDIHPRLVFRKSRRECILLCPKQIPGHKYSVKLSGSTECPFPCCSKRNDVKLCGNSKCVICHPRSLASHEKSKYFSEDNTDKEGNKITANKVLLGSSEKYTFICSKSNHKFSSQVSNITRKSKASWCPYPCCNKYPILCDDDKCKICEKASFASSPKKIYFSDKNKFSARKYAKSSHEFCKFVCENGHEFEKQLFHVNYGSWCPRCYFNDETECIEIIEKLTGEKFKKCRPKFLENLEFDGYNEDLKLAIEYNGEQHYKFSSLFHKKNMEEFKKQKERDIKKGNLCIKNNIHLITIPHWEKLNKEKFILEEYNKYREKNNLPRINYDKKIFEKTKIKKAKDDKEIKKEKIKTVKKVEDDKEIKKEKIKTVKKVEDDKENKKVKKVVNKTEDDKEIKKEKIKTVKKTRIF
jgi:hypothetical protein